MRGIERSHGIVRRIRSLGHKASESTREERLDRAVARDSAREAGAGSAGDT